MKELLIILAIVFVFFTAAAVMLQLKTGIFLILLCCSMGAFLLGAVMGAMWNRLKS